MRRQSFANLPVTKLPYFAHLLNSWRKKLRKRDPIVEEVRKARDAYAKRFDYDLDAICRDLQAKQRSSDKKVISLPPKRPRKLVMCERANLPRVAPYI